MTSLTFYFLFFLFFIITQYKLCDVFYVSFLIPHTTAKHIKITCLPNNEVIIK